MLAVWYVGLGLFALLGLNAQFNRVTARELAAERRRLSRLTMSLRGRRR